EAGDVAVVVVDVEGARGVKDETAGVIERAGVRFGFVERGQRLAVVFAAGAEDAEGAVVVVGDPGSPGEINRHPAGAVEVAGWRQVGQRGDLWRGRHRRKHEEWVRGRRLCRCAQAQRRAEREQESTAATKPAAALAGGAHRGGPT